MKNLLTHLIAVALGIGIGYFIWGRNEQNKSEEQAQIIESTTPKNEIVDYDILIETLEQIKNISDTSNFKTYSRTVKNITQTQNVLTELKDFRLSWFNATKDSEEIPYDTATSRRAKFKTNFPRIAELLPTYFEIEKKDIDSLLTLNPEAIRMYPVSEERTNKHTFTWAFIGTDKVGETGKNIKSKVVDVINPCPPPTGCEELE